MDAVAPTEQLARLRAALQGAYAVPPDVARWMLDALADFERGGQRTLCGALGLRARGHRSLKTTRQYNQRNELLARAFSQTDGAGGSSNWARCVYLAVAVRRLNRAGGHTPSSAASWEEGLFKTLTQMQSAGVPAPGSARRIYGLLRSSLK